jgi:hypothetical protein
MIVVALVAGAWVSVAAAGGEPEYSDADCETLSSIEVKGNDSGYYGATARNASKAFKSAAADFEDEDLKDAASTLSKTWGKAGKAKGAIGAAKVLGKAGKPYYDALEVYTKALIVCSTQGLGLDSDDSDDD